MTRISAPTRGKSAQMFFVALALEYGWNPQLTLNEDLPFDVVIQKPGEPYAEVQVKRMFPRKGRSAPYVDMKKQGQGYEADDADYLAAVDMERGRFYLIPWEEVYEVKRKAIQHDQFAQYCHALC